MRFSSLTALALMLFAAPAMALTAEKPIFGSYVCPQKVPCDNYGTFSSEQWAQAGKACLENGFGYNAGETPFDTSSGLDSSNCLVTESSPTPKGPAGQMVPRCCVVKQETGACNLNCKLIQG